MPLGTDLGLGPGDIVLDETQLPQKGGLPKKEAAQPPRTYFRPMSIDVYAKRLDRLRCYLVWR